MISGIAGSSNPQSNIPSNVQSAATESSVQEPSTSTPRAKIEAKAKPKPKPTCNGTSVTKDCEAEGIAYKTYVYHAAVPEKSHTETTTTYKDEISGYCTLCRDGTYSPSCATGRGACSHHGGVAEWNAPRYRKVPQQTTNTVVDAPAQEAYYEKIPL